MLIPTIMSDSLLDRSNHLAIGFETNEHPNLEVVQSFRCGLVCVMKEGHPLASKSVVRPTDLVGQRIITYPENTMFGQMLLRSYGTLASKLHLDIEVRSSTTACWHAQAGAGIAVVDEAAVLGMSFTGLAVRKFQSRERLQINIMRNRFLPMSTIQKAFCKAFVTVWDQSRLNG